MKLIETIQFAVKNKRNDLIYDSFMFESLKKKKEALLFFIKVLEEDITGKTFVSILIDLIRNPDELNEPCFDYTFLQESILSDKLEFFSLLLLNGASLDALSKNGVSGYDLAFEKGSDKLLNFIIDYENTLAEVLSKSVRH